MTERPFNRQINKLMTNSNTFKASPEAKATATKFRTFAIIGWVVAMIGQALAIMKLISDETLFLLLGAMAVILVIAFFSGRFWKKSNKLDPTSEKNGLRFFFQNQLGAIMGVLCFLPMVISIFTSNNISGKTKAIAGTAASAAMTAAGISGAEFDAASIEKYSEEIKKQNKEAENVGINTGKVYWSKAGNKYHAFNDCQYIKGKSLNSGSIKKSWEEKGISELCKVCRKRSAKSSSVKSTAKEKAKELMEVN